MTNTGTGSHYLQSMSTTPTVPNAAFADLGLSKKLIDILDNLKFVHPTPIQQQSIPVAADGKDIMGIAQTGTGKTLAFVLPMLQQIARTKKQGLIILPTRELAQQVDDQVKMIGKTLGVKTALVIGGSSMSHQIRDLKRNPHIVIGTPGRIVDLLKQNNMKLGGVGVLVLDEADRMLDMGFAPDIQRILKHVPRERQTLLFSATMPKEIVNIATKYMKSPVRIEIARAGSVTKQIDQELFVIKREDKLRLLDKLLSEYPGTVLVFSRTKYGAKKICRAVKGMGHDAAEIHSNLSLNQRKRSLQGFKSGKYRVLVATDIAARGIDVDNIELVINFDLPDNPDDYVHRVGRTGRAGKTGKAVSFVTPDQKNKLYMIERLVKTRLPISDVPQLPAGRPKPKHSGRDDGRGGRSRGRSGRGSYQRGGNKRGGRNRSSSRKAPRVHH